MTGIEVHVRMRPVQSGSIWSASDSLLYCTARPEARFMFHRVHPASVKNDVMFHTIEPLCHAAFGGRPVTVLAYGQTAAGKTHSMMGSRDDPGLIPRAAKTLIDLVRQHSKSDAGSAMLSCGFIEVYNECVTDLMVDPRVAAAAAAGPTDKYGGGVGNKNNHNDGDRSSSVSPVPKTMMNNNGAAGAELILREAPDGSAIIPDRIMVPITCEDDFANAVRTSEGNRRYGATDLNQRSSRSHVVLTFEISRHVAGGTNGGSSRQKSLLQFVDLAGSECAGKSNTEGSALREGGYINKSLLTLGNVVDAIVDKRQHVPFRESKLTRILRNCLGGKSLTFLICCVNPTRDNYDQTLTSLRFAQRAMKVTGDPGLVLNIAPLVCHTMARSLRAREKRMAQLEDLSYQRGMQDGFLECRGHIGPLMQQVEEEATEILHQHQQVAHAVLAHDQQRALRALQEAQQPVKLRGKTLGESEHILDAQRREAEQVAARRFDVDERRAVVGEEMQSLAASKEQLGKERAELQVQRRLAAERQLGMLDVQYTAAAVATESQYWHGLCQTAQQHLSQLIPGYICCSQTPGGTQQQQQQQQQQLLAHDAPLTAAMQLRTLQQFKARIDKENSELNDLLAALKTINECLDPDSDGGNSSSGNDGNKNNAMLMMMDPALNVDTESALLSAHIESVEASQRAAKQNLLLHQQQHQQNNSNVNTNNAVSHSNRASPIRNNINNYQQGQGNRNTGLESPRIVAVAAGGGNSGNRINHSNNNGSSARSFSRVRSPSPKDNTSKHQQQQQNNSFGSNQHNLSSLSQHGATTTTTATATATAAQQRPTDVLPVARVINNNNNNNSHSSSFATSSSSSHLSSASLHTDGSAGNVSAHVNNNNNNTTLRPRSTLDALRAAQEKYLTPQDRQEFERQQQQQRATTQINSNTNNSSTGSNITGTRAATPTRNLHGSSNMNNVSRVTNHSAATLRASNAAPPQSFAGARAIAGTASPLNMSQNTNSNNNMNQSNNRPRSMLPLSPRPRDRDESGDGENVGPVVPANTAARAAARKQQQQLNDIQKMMATQNAMILQQQQAPITAQQPMAQKSKLKGKAAWKAKQEALKQQQLQQQHDDDDDDDDDSDVQVMSQNQHLNQRQNVAVGLFQSPTSLTPVAAEVKKQKPRGKK